MENRTEKSKSRRDFTADEVKAMYGPKPWHDTEAMDEMQRTYLEELPERWPDAECPEHCAIAFMDGMRRFRAAISPFIPPPLEDKIAQLERENRRMREAGKALREALDNATWGFFTPQDPEIKKLLVAWDALSFYTTKPTI